MLRNTTKLSSVLVMNSSVPVIVNFHAEWCDPCKILTPKLIELIGPMDKLDLAIVNLESNPELVHIFEVKAVPAIIAISSGLVVDKIVGLTDLDIIENLIQKLTNTPVNSENDKREV
ncbi:Thioredoxin, mitochondrial [Anthophora plagiata]